MSEAKPSWPTMKTERTELLALPIRGVDDTIGPFPVTGEEGSMPNDSLACFMDDEGIWWNIAWDLHEREICRVRGTYNAKH